MTTTPDPLADACAGGDCAEVLAQVYVYLDGELDDGTRGQLAAHLEECGPCLREYGVEDHVKQLVHRCCGGEPAPQELRDGVLARLRSAGCQP